MRVFGFIALLMLVGNAPARAEDKAPTPTAAPPAQAQAKTEAAKPEDEGFKLIHVKDAEPLWNDGKKEGAKAHFFDANAPDFREKNGVIPGATLLSSFDGYDATKELGPDKSAKVIFYCANTH
jgi:hypothetical protein